MKTQQFATLALIAIVGIALIGCKEDDTPEHVHDFGTAWVKNATQHWHECSCGEKSDVANHTWDWVETRPATTEAEGVETETCTICGQTNGTRTIAKITCQCPEGTTHEPDENCCEGKDCNCPIAQPFTIGTVSFVFEYSKDDTTSWAKLEPVIQIYDTYIIQNPTAPQTATITNLSSRVGAEYRIIVDYSDEGKSTGFTATDAQTLIVGSVYLATTTFNNPSALYNAFNAMYAKPYPIPDDSP